MKLMMIAAASLGLILAGCSASDRGGRADSQQAESAAAAQPAATENAPAPVAYEVGQEVDLSGSIGCAHCTFHVADSCAAAVQTSDDQVVVLDVGEDSELFTKRYDGGTVEVKGVIDDAGDPPHVKVETYNLGS